MYMEKKDYCFMWRKALPVLLLLSAAFVWTGGRLCAAPRSEGEARLIAENFLKTQTVSVKRSAGASEGLVLAATSADLSPSVKRTVAGDSPAWYAFNQGTEAFVIVSGDDRMSDILGYSTEGGFVTEGMPDNILSWLNAYTDLAEAVESGPAVAARAMLPADAGYPESVLPLLGDIQYNQDAPYNNHCPLLNGEHCATGCAATAAVTIMSNWKYPERGTGHHSYTLENNGIPCSFDFGATTFDWGNILPTYVEGEYTEEQAEAIATLMYASGVSMNMNYGTTSYANIDMILAGMIRYFGYNPYAIIRERMYYTTQEWMELVYGELSSGYPVLYGGQNLNMEGHAFVVDGYDRNGLVHVDWGWGGMSNGYFDIALLDPTGLGIGGGTGGGFSFEQMMLTGLVPPAVNSTPTSSFGQMVDFRIEGEMASISSVMNMGSNTTGCLAFIAERDGMQMPVSQYISFEQLPVFIGPVNVRLPLFFPTEAGDYRIYLGSRVVGEARWTKARSHNNDIDEYQLTVHEDGTYELVPGEERMSQPEVTVTCNEVVDANCYADFRISVENPNDSDYMPGYLYLFKGDATNDESMFLKFSFFLTPGQDTTFVCSSVMPDMEGRLNLKAYWQTSGRRELLPLDCDLDIEVRKRVVADSVHLRNAWLDRDTYAQGDTITCTWQVDIEGQEADIYSKQLLVGVCLDNLQTVVRYYLPIVNVEQGQVSEFSQQMVADFAPGNYYFVIVNFETTKVMWYQAFTITASSTGIDEVRAEAGVRPEWCPVPGSTDLRFRYAKDVERVALYDMTGRLVRTAEPVRGADGVYTVSGSGLQHAPYILRIHAADGSVATLKLMR